MASRPRRSAAKRASEAITDMAEISERPMSSRSSARRSDYRRSAEPERRSGRTSGVSVSRDPPSSPGDSKQHLNLTVKVSSNKLRQATSTRPTRNPLVASGREQFAGGEIIAGKRNRGARKSYVVESDTDDEEEEPEGMDDEEMDEDEREEEEDEDDDDDAEGEDEEDEEVDELGDDDPEGEEGDDDMDVDAEGEDDDLADEDADGDIDMDLVPLPPPTIKISRPNKPPVRPKPPVKLIHAEATPAPDDDDDDDELSDLAPSEIENTITYGDDGLGEEDAEGEEEEDEIEVAGEEEEEGDVEELDSDGETPGGGSRAETPDLTKMTKRQRARFEDAPQEYMKLSDEVQVKKHFTAEELSMRRAEMARRRRNLSEKRNEEVKMETINKLLKKQAPKTNRRGLHLAGDESPDFMTAKADPLFVRWISNKSGSRLAIPEDMVIGPVGDTFKPQVARTVQSGKMVEEVS